MSFAILYKMSTPAKGNVKWRKSRIEVFTVLKEVYGDNLMPKSSFDERHKKF